jgi:hypothetical protein
VRKIVLCQLSSTVCPTCCPSKSSCDPIRTPGSPSPRLLPKKKRKYPCDDHKRRRARAPRIQRKPQVVPWLLFHTGQQLMMTTNTRPALRTNACQVLMVHLVDWIFHDSCGREIPTTTTRRGSRLPRQPIMIPRLRMAENRGSFPPTTHAPPPTPPPFELRDGEYTTTGTHAHGLAFCASVLFHRDSQQRRCCPLLLAARPT